jgi:hypothetical protein
VERAGLAIEIRSGPSKPHDGNKRGPIARWQLPRVQRGLCIRSLYHTPKPNDTFTPHENKPIALFSDIYVADAFTTRSSKLHQDGNKRGPSLSQGDGSMGMGQC